MKNGLTGLVLVAISFISLSARAAEPARNRDTTPAKQLFGAVERPAALKPRAIGFYSRGCLAGAKQLAIDGPAWQAMRLSRNRNWGHPELIAVVERLAREAKANDGWPGLLVGDLAQPRGGPMRTGHASHQIGLDADIWLTPMPDRRLSESEREKLSATSMLGADKLSVNQSVWTAAHFKLVKRAASYANVERVLVHPAIKRALCRHADLTTDRAWLAKVRPYWGHHYHFHVRIGCPKGSEGCRPQSPVGDDHGCGKELDDWFKLLTAPPKPAKPSAPRPPMTLSQLPEECTAVLNTSDSSPNSVAPPPPERRPDGPAAGSNPPPPQHGAAKPDPIGKLIQSLPWSAVSGR